MPHENRVQIEVSKEVIDKLEHGSDVEMRLIGRISALESREVPDFEAEDREEGGGPPPKRTMHEVGLDVSKVRVSKRSEVDSELFDEEED